MSPITPRPVVVAAGGFVDVVSVNHYELLLGAHLWLPRITRAAHTRNALREFHELAKRPVLVTEFGFRAVTDTHRSTSPPIFPRLDTQRARGWRTWRYVRRMVQADYIVGYHLFEWFDQPLNGRRSGKENNNLDVVDLENRIYPAYVAYLRKANATVPD